MDIGGVINYNARQCLQARTGWFWQEREGRPDRGCSSGVEHNLAKVGVVGSNPIARSKFSKNLDKLRTKPSCPLSAECPRNVFASRSGQDESSETVGVGQREGHEPYQTPSSSNGRASKNAVRERSAAPATHRDCQDRVERPAHPSNRLVAQLNANWRVVDDPLQWRLQRKKGNSRKKNSGWQDRSFCTTLAGLLRCVRECCGEIEPAALATFHSLPDQHSMQNLDVRGTYRAQVEKQSKSLASQRFGGLQG
jgi:hypothetical protein